MKRFRIRINLDRLRENVSKADTRVWSEAELLQWLHDAGFTPDGDAWLTAEADLGQLEPEEVTTVEDVDDVTTDIPVRTRHFDPPTPAARRRVHTAPTVDANTKSLHYRFRPSRPG